MSVLESVRAFAAIQLAAVGLSHVLAHRAWASFFVGLRERGDAGVLVVALLSLGVGAFVVAFHPVWSGIPLVLTLMGWAQVLKGLVYFCLPSFGLRRLETVSVERARMFVYPGAVFVLFAGLLVYHLLVT